MTFEIYAQSYTTPQQIRKEIEAPSEFEALQIAFIELADAGYYVTQAKRVDPRS